MTHKCSAPICNRDTNTNYKNEVIWYAGEDVCNATPRKKFQKRQININNLLGIGKFKYKDTAFMASTLEK